MRLLEYLFKNFLYPRSEQKVILIKVKSGKALLNMLMLCIGSYLRSILRHEFLIPDTCHPDTLCLCEEGGEECDDLWLFFKGKGVCKHKNLGKKWSNLQQVEQLACASYKHHKMFEILTCFSLFGSILNALDQRLDRKAAVLTRDACLVLPPYCRHLLLHRRQQRAAGVCRNHRELCWHVWPSSCYGRVFLRCYNKRRTVTTEVKQCNTCQYIALMNMQYIYTKQRSSNEHRSLFAP